MANPGDGVVIQVAMSNLQIVRNIFLVDRKSVVLRRDFDFTRIQLQHRLVGASMAELQLERFCATSKPTTTGVLNRYRKSVSFLEGCVLF